MNAMSWDTHLLESPPESGDTHQPGDPAAREASNGAGDSQQGSSGDTHGVQPPWTDAELDLLGAVVRGDPRSWRALRPLAQRWVRSTLRQVYVVPGRLLIKRYLNYPGRRDPRRPWRREHRALQRLRGLPVPRSYGLVRSRAADGARAVTVAKSYIPGEPLAGFDEARLEEAAGLLAGFHRRGVVTMDPQLANFLVGRDGLLYFVDLGRARCLPARSPALELHIGKEMVRFRREALAGDAALDERFQAAYWRARGEPGRWRWRAVEGSRAWWARRYERKHGCPG